MYDLVDDVPRLLFKVFMIMLLILFIIFHNDGLAMVRVMAMM